MIFIVVIFNQFFDDSRFIEVLLSQLLLTHPLDHFLFRNKCIFQPIFNYIKFSILLILAIKLILLFLLFLLFLLLLGLLLWLLSVIFNLHV